MPWTIFRQISTLSDPTDPDEPFRPKLLLEHTLWTFWTSFKPLDSFNLSTPFDLLETLDPPDNL